VPAVSSLPENETVGSALRLKRGSAEPSPFKELTLILSTERPDGSRPILLVAKRRNSGDLYCAWRRARLRRKPAP
jgi:hypothetical protein